MGIILVCQFAHQSFLATRIHPDPGQADWDWTRVWLCPLEPPARRGSLRLGLRETKNTQKVSLGELHALNNNDLARIIFYYLLICLLYREKVISACVESVSEVKMKAQKEEGQVRERLWNTPVSLSCRKIWAHIYITSSFSKHSDRHFQHWHFHGSVWHTHTHTRAHTHKPTPRISLQYT